ncbi:MAG: CinA family protein [Gammaproteobacteria bacterium]|nr:CinA family protein [Gammaproteobacteria bacterium]
MRDLNDTLQRIAQHAQRQQLHVTTAESCTGGLIAKSITDRPGSSDWFEYGFVTYSNAAKTDLLGVDPQTIESQGAVSDATVRAMAEGALARAGADYAIAVSGVAGPGGGTANNPVGSVWIACAGGGSTVSAHLQLDGDRTSIRERSALLALQMLHDRMTSA